MACGCAIVASDVGETGRLVSDNVGFRVALSADEVAERIAWLLNHPKQAQEMGRKAREKVIEKFSIYHVSEMYYQLYFSLTPK